MEACYGDDSFMVIQTLKYTHHLLKIIGAISFGKQDFLVNTTVVLTTSVGNAL